MNAILAIFGAFVIAMSVAVGYGLDKLEDRIKKLESAR